MKVSTYDVLIKLVNFLNSKKNWYSRLPVAKATVTLTVKKFITGALPSEKKTGKFNPFGHYF